MLTNDENYIKDLKSVEEKITASKYTISKDDAKKKAQNELALTYMKEKVNSVALGYENYIEGLENKLEEKDVIIQEKDNVIETYKNALVNSDVPIPKVVSSNCVAVVRNESDANKLNKAAQRIAGFIGGNYNVGDKFYVCNKSNDKKKAFRITN
jgi:hypothetical protein